MAIDRTLAQSVYATATPPDQDDLGNVDANEIKDTTVPTPPSATVSTDDLLKDKPNASPPSTDDPQSQPGPGELSIDPNDLQKLAAAQQGTIFGIPRRLWLVLLSCLGLAISYADRSNIAIAIIPMSKEFGWTPAIEGAIFSCFFYGYMATQILGGYLADKFGGKWVFGLGTPFAP